MKLPDIPDFTDISYLKNGNEKQQTVFLIISAHGLLEKLHLYTPLLTGTIPLELDQNDSDLDIICTWSDADAFCKDLTFCFSGYENWFIKRKVIKKQKTIIARFILEDFQVEIFGQAIPVKDQYAYRHMVIEYTLLKMKGPGFFQQIKLLRRQGYKTEPAFCNALGIKGDPYDGLIRYWEELNQV